MNLEEKAKFFDEMVEIIDKHKIESDGINQNSKDFTYPSILEDVLERYLYSMEKFKKIK